MVTQPTFLYERQLIARGYRAIVGIDEVGYGAWAGPVVTAAVILPLSSRIGLIRDSKQLSIKQRDLVYDQILEKCLAWSIGSASPQEIDEKNIRQATYLAMRRAVQALPMADFVLVDAWQIPELHLPQQGVTSGDKQVKSIAAASIVAKVFRDRLMVELAQKYPEYGFGRHKGYGTAQHRIAIEEHGACPIHRISYKVF